MRGTAPAPLDSLISEFAATREGAVRFRSRTRRVEHQGAPLHLKISAEPLDTEARMLDRCAAIAGDGVATPPLIRYSAEHNVLVTEDVGGTVLFNAVWNSTSVWRPIRWRTFDWVSTTRAIDGWLRRFHALGIGAAEQPDDGTRERCLTYLRRDLQFKLRAIQHHGGNVLSEATVEQLQNRVDRLASADAWTSLPLTSIHGDLTLANLRLLPKAQVIVTDFADSRTGFALEDTVRLWASFWELTKTGAYRRQLLHPCLAELTRDSESEPFTMLRIWNGVVRLSEAALPGRSSAGRDRRRVARLARIHRDWLLESLRSP